MARSFELGRRSVQYVPRMCRFPFLFVFVEFHMSSFKGTSNFANIHRFTAHPITQKRTTHKQSQKTQRSLFCREETQEPGDILYVLKKRVEATNEETDTRSIEKRVGKKNNKYGRNGGTNKISVTWTHMDTLGHPAVTKVNKKSRKKRRDRYAAIYALFFVCSNHSLAHPGPVLHYNAARPRWICVPFIG